MGVGGDGVRWCRRGTGVGRQGELLDNSCLSTLCLLCPHGIRFIVACSEEGGLRHISSVGATEKTCLVDMISGYYDIFIIANMFLDGLGLI